MNSPYKYRKPVGRSHFSIFRGYVFIAAVLIVLVGGIAYFIYSGTHGKTPAASNSAVQNTVITTAMTDYQGPYFKFQDSGDKWVLNQAVSNADKYIYVKYHGENHVAQMTIYVNQVPQPLYLSVSRVLPVRIVNDNSFQVTGVSDDCSYKEAGQPHHIENVTINGATFLCDPDTPQYTVVLSAVGGDYRLQLKRPDSTPIQFVIVYQYLELTPTPDSIVNIASSFQTI